MRIRTAFAVAALAAASLLGSAGVAAADSETPEKFVITDVAKLSAEGGIPPCDEALYSTPSAAICS
ncbi:hypothetical protein [Streptomyces sp. CA-132043]|uniref:hypothetical protein n=1 Tax=Streptomyces sp. CA-132043 TaxID=3240048 RepID=UPI003D8A6F5A